MILLDRFDAAVLAGDVPAVRETLDEAAGIICGCYPDTAAAVSREISDGLACLSDDFCRARGRSLLRSIVAKAEKIGRGGAVDVHAPLQLQARPATGLAMR